MRRLFRLRVQGRLAGVADEDPLGGIANLFDAAMVFAVALLLAFAAYSGRRELRPAEPAGDRKPEAGDLPLRDLETLERFRPSERTLGGRGTRLGVAYRLESGEVVYVPDRRK